MVWFREAGTGIKSCYMDTNSFIVYIKTEHIYIWCWNEIDTSNYKLDKTLPTIFHLIGLMKDELGEEVMAEFAALRPKMFSYLGDSSENPKNNKSDSTRK